MPEIVEYEPFHSAPVVKLDSIVLTLVSKPFSALVARVISLFKLVVNVLSAFVARVISLDTDDKISLIAETKLVLLDVFKPLKTPSAPVARVVSLFKLVVNVFSAFVALVTSFEIKVTISLIATTKLFLFVVFKLVNVPSTPVARATSLLINVELAFSALVALVISFDKFNTFSFIAFTNEVFTVVFKLFNAPSTPVALATSLLIAVLLAFSAAVALVISLFKLVVNVASAAIALLVSFVKLVVKVFSTFVARVISLFKLVVNVFSAFVARVCSVDTN